MNGPGNVSRGNCGLGNDFPGFLAHCAYHYWDFTRVLACGTTGQLLQPPFGLAICTPTSATPSGCLPVVAGGRAPTFGGANQPFLEP